MSRVETRATVPRDRLPDILAPKDGVVLERDLGGGQFNAAGGPFSSYRRTVTVEDGVEAADALVSQVVDFHLALPRFGWILVPLFRAHLRKLEEPKGPPWWAPTDRIDPPASLTLASLGAVAVVLGYLGYILPQTITYAAQQFHANNAAQGVTLASTRADIVVALGLIALADRRGRRRLLLVSTGAACVLTAAGALAPSLAWLAASQVAASGCVTAGIVIITIIAAETMPRSSRAYSLSLLTVAGSIGAGVVLALLPVADVKGLHGHGWRVLYAVGLIGLPMVIRIGRRLPESPRYLAAHTEAPLRGHSRRLWLLAGAGLLLNLFLAPSSEFLNQFLRHERHYSASHISLFVAITSIPGGIGLMVGGRMAETRGRRVIASVAVAGGVGFTVLEFLNRGWLMWTTSTVSTIFAAAVVPAFGIFGPELFPTSLRGKANAAIQAVSRIGSVIGLILVGRLSDHLGSFGPAMAIVAVGPLALVVLILVAFPETAHRELEDLNPEDRPPPTEA